MKKLTSAAAAVAMLLGMGVGLAGCGEETGVKSETQVKGPGGTATVTESKTVKTTGENPPPVSSDNKTP